MSRKEMMERIMTMFADFPEQIQEAIVTGAQLGQMMQQTTDTEQQPQG